MDHWTCPHGIVTGFFTVPNDPYSIEFRSCDTCCDEISDFLALPISAMDYTHQFNAHVLAYLDDLISRTEAASVAHVFGTYY